MPIGENNSFSPGEADRGQPTFFMPRRNRYTFTVTVPADWGDRELVWTLNANGHESQAYTNKHQDFFINNVVISSEGGSLGGGRTTPETYANVAPTVTVEVTMSAQWLWASGVLRASLVGLERSFRPSSRYVWANRSDCVLI